MNSVDDIRPYQERIYHSPKANRKTSATTYDFPEHPPKKDKKWSLGSLFRRKKKEETESTTEEEQDKKGFLTRRKKKPDKRKKGNKQKGTFDHIVVPNSTTLRNNGYFYDETGILSDPTGGFASYQGRTTLSRTPQSTRKLPKTETARDISHRNVLDRPSLGSADSLLKKNRKDLAKLRAEARRETHYCESSSDEDSQRSASSSRLRSDENINRMRDGSMSRKSRGARTERYIRRLSKDEEGFANLRSSKSDIENGYRRLMLQEKKEKPRSPKMTRNSHFKLPSSITVLSGLSTIPPSHTNCKRNSRDSVSSPNFMKPPINNSNITNKYGSLSSNDPKDNPPSYQRSISYDADIHRSASPEMQADIIHAQLPLGKPSHRYRNLSLVEQPRFFKQRQPPPPPPRDPWRIGTTQHLETGRPMSYCFERSQQKQAPLHEFNHRIEPKPHSFNWKPNFRSTSEDCLPAESSPIPFHPRPASATTDHPKQRVLRKTIGGTDASEHYQYLTDKNPRSRKPICIQPFGANEDKNEIHRQNESKKAIDFWKKIDQDVSRMQEKTNISKNTSEAPKTSDYRKQKDDQNDKKSVPTSPQMFRASTHVRTNIFASNTFKGDDAKRTTSPFKPIDMGADECDGAVKSPLPVTKSASIDSITNEIVNSQANERKSANLEDALDELEAIYNSLRLGDEDLLERAEQREKSIAAKKLMDATLESYPGWGPIPRGAVSDSSFSYEPFDAVDSPKRKRFFKKTRIPDRKNDDMALRKMSKERSKTISDPKEALAKVSYLLASPCYGNEMDPTPTKTNAKEPDIILDDVVLRTFKHANNSLKVSDPQLPFGIPVMPVLPAPNSDYLHAMPENCTSYTSDNKKIPDVVKDDLAFRNLRKDANKEPVLPSFMHDDLINNNNNSVLNLKPTFGSMKKKRAMRSLSANIYNLMQGDPFYTDYRDEDQPKQFEKSNLSDIADAMEIARQILKEKEEKINATRRAFLSDTEAKYRKKDVTDHLTESKLNFLNSMKSKQEAAEVQQRVIVNVPKNDACIQSKPPRGMTPERKLSKEPSSSDLFKEDNYRSSLDDLLSAFAVEAQQASKRITGEIKPLDSDTSDKRKSNYDDNKLTSPALVVEARKSSSPSVFEGRKSSSPPVDIEESKMTSSPSPPRIDLFESIAPPKEFSNEGDDTITVKAQVVPLAEAEEVDRIISDEEKLESVANIVLNCNNDVPFPSSAEELDSEHDYVNMGSDAEFDKAIPLIDDSTPRRCMSPFEEHKAKLIANFQELKNIESDSEKEPRAENPEEEAVAESGEGEACVVLSSNAITPEDRECAYLTESFVQLSESGNIASYVSGCDIRFSTSSTQTTSESIESKPTELDKLDVKLNRLLLNESPHSSGFHSNSVSDNDPNDDDLHMDCKLSDFSELLGLKSPQLVLDSIHSRIKSVDVADVAPNSKFVVANNYQNFKSEDDLDVPSTSKSVSKCKGNLEDSKEGRLSESRVLDGASRDTTIKPTQSRDRRHSPGDSEPSSTWNIDPLALAFACSYGIACTYQVVNYDLVAIFGLVLVFLSFFAALIM